MTKEQKKFIKHLKKCTKEVSKWPKWKQNIFGKVTYKYSDED